MVDGRRPSLAIETYAHGIVRKRGDSVGSSPIGDFSPRSPFDAESDDEKPPVDSETKAHEVTKSTLATVTKQLAAKAREAEAKHLEHKQHLSTLENTAAQKDQILHELHQLQDYIHDHPILKSSFNASINGLDFHLTSSHPEYNNSIKSSPHIKIKQDVNGNQVITTNFGLHELPQAKEFHQHMRASLDAFAKKIERQRVQIENQLWGYGAAVAGIAIMGVFAFLNSSKPTSSPTPGSTPIFKP